MAIKQVSLTNEFILKIAGVCVFLFYLIISINSELIPGWLAVPFIMLAGPILYLIIQHIFSSRFVSSILLKKMRNGIILLSIAFIVFTILSIIQQTGLIRYKTIANKDLEETFFLVNSIQLGFDLVFDVFYGLGIMIISNVLLTENKRSLVGWIGVISSTLLLGINILTFPEPPTTKGFIDMGPITLLWWILLIIKIKSNNLWQKHQVK
ncbi:MAG: hypothetical protein JNL24_02040 [Bacteroidia bacterium]|nr:hypothetical protein [Bacteroidia bacterium]